MRFKYRNVKTGAEFESNCEISAPTLIRVEAEAPAPIIEPEPQAEEEVKPEPKPKAKTKDESADQNKKGAKK